MCVLKRKNSGHRIQQIYLHVWQRFYIAVVLGSETIGNLEWNYLKVRIIIFFFSSQLQALGVSSKTLEWLHSYVIVLFQRVHWHARYQFSILMLRYWNMGSPTNHRVHIFLLVFQEEVFFPHHAVKMAQSYSAFLKMPSNLCVWLVNAAFYLKVGFIF